MQKEGSRWLNNLTEQDWRQHGNYEIDDLPKEAFAVDRVSPPMDNINFFNDIVLSIVVPEYWTIDFLFANRLKTGDIAPIQPGNYWEGNKDFNLDYVGVIPFGDWSGGNMLFPDQNLTVQLEPGDLLIFNPDIPVGVSKIESGTRYSIINYIIKVPPRFII